jgi:hypothetical protein
MAPLGPGRQRGQCVRKQTIRDARQRLSVPSQQLPNREVNNERRLTWGREVR